CGGAGPSAYGRDVRVGAVSGEGCAIVNQAELNQDVERFVSEFMFDVAQGMQAIEEAPEPRVRALGQRRTLVYYATALDIASGPLSRAERRGHARLRDAGSRCPRGVLDTDGARRAGPALARRLHAGRGAHAASVREDLERRAAGSGAGARRGLAAPPSRGLRRRGGALRAVRLPGGGGRRGAGEACARVVRADPFGDADGGRGAPPRGAGPVPLPSAPVLAAPAG